MKCWCIGFDEADVSGYIDSFRADSCLSVPKSAAVLPEVKPPVEDWNLQVQLFSQVDVEFFKIFQADPYNHRKPKSSIVMDTETYCTTDVSMESTLSTPQNLVLIRLLI